MISNQKPDNVYILTEESLRSVAVSLVDGTHGYTMEFAPSPAAHRNEYDRAESALKIAVEEEQPGDPHPENETLNHQIERMQKLLASHKQAGVEIEGKLNKYQSERAFRSFRIKVGAKVTPISRNAHKVYVVSRMQHFGGLSNWKPTLYGKPLKKDGTPSEREEYIGSDWRIVEEKEAVHG